MTNNNDIDALRYAEDVRIDQIILISSNGLATDVYNVFIELNLYEDIYSPTLSGDIVIEDGLNITQYGQFTGNEKILFTFYTPGDTQKITKLMDIYKISDRIRQSDKVQTYVLHFVSPEFTKNISTKVSKSFNGPISSTINNILTDQRYIGTEKKFEFETTLKPFHCVIPNWTPFKTINWLSERCLSSETNTADLMFYETVDGYNFRSMSSLSKTQPEIVYTYAQESHGEVDYNKLLGYNELTRDFYTVSEYNVKSSFDSIKNTESGMYSGRLYIHDITSGKLFDYTYDYLEHFERDSNLKLNKGAFLQTQSNISEDRLNKNFDASVLLVSDQSFIFNDVEDNYRYKEWKLQRKSRLLQFNSSQLEIVVPGDSRRRVGEVIEVVIPSAESFEDNQYQIDNMLSGKYIITGIRHIVREEKYQCAMTLSRDSYLFKLGLDNNTSGAI